MVWQLTGMARTCFFRTSVPASSRKPGKPQLRNRLSKEARVAITAARHEASAKYQNALENAYTDVEQKIKVIAGAHSKSVQRVKAELYMAPTVLVTSHS